MYQLLVRPLCCLPLKALHKNVKMNPWEFHDVLTFFRFINVPQRTRKTSSINFGIRGHLTDLRRDYLKESQSIDPNKLSLV